MLRFFLSIFYLVVLIAVLVLPDNFTLAQNIKSSRPVPEEKTDVKFGNRTVATRVDDFLTAAGATGGVLVAKDGKVILHKGYGWADEERKIPISPKTVFDIGSITKQFTAAGILKLEEQGKLKVTDSITKFFAGVPADKADITLHQLLTHSAGLVDGFGGDYEKVLRDEIVQKVLTSKLLSAPGEKYKYSNVGYSLLAAIIEIVGGKSYERYLYENLFAPAGMNETGYIIPKWKSENLAVGYAGDGSRWGTPLEHAWDENGPFWNLHGNGGILSTLGDLYKWHLALEGEKILSKAAKEKYFAPHVKIQPEGVSFYAYGWGTRKTPRGTRLVSHSGSNDIFYATFRRYVDENVVILDFTNQARTSNPIFSSVPKAVFGEELPSFPKPAVALARSELQKYVGTYELPSGDRFTLDAVNNRLVVKAASPPGVVKLLTTFLQLEDSERLRDLESRTAKVIENIAREDFEPIRGLIYFEGTLDEEKAYWKQTFADWTKRFGKFKKSEVIGSVTDKEFLNTYVLLQFERGATPVTYRQNEKKQFYIGTSTAFLPRYYNLTPQSKTEFLIYNYALKTSTPVNFSLGAKNVVTGLTIEDEQGKIYARKILPVQPE